MPVNKKNGTNDDADTDDYILMYFVYGIIMVLISTLLMKVGYNYVVVNGISIDPASGAPRLASISLTQAFVLNIMLGIFIVPPIIMPSCVTMCKKKKKP